MTHSPKTRTSWDTSVKIYVRNNLHLSLPVEALKSISRSNIHKWKKEPADKYKNCGLTQIIHEEIEFIKKTQPYPVSKKVFSAYINLLESVHEIFNGVKGVRKIIADNKDTIVNTIESVKDYVPTNEAIKWFNISRGTYQNYKVLVLNKCDTSYFKWCLKRYPHQLLNREINKIESYCKEDKYKYWSKSSLYYLGLRNNDFSFGLTTFYKYSKLLGYKSNRHLHPKKKYTPLVSTRPNEIWCADVTILKTLDDKKHYIHFLMDHFSKMILGYTVENSSCPKAIKSLLQEAYLKHKNKEPITFLTDAGVENVNTTVKEFIATTDQDIKHLIAQKDIPFSNSKIEAFNKIIKHQFLLPQNLTNRAALDIALTADVLTYNTLRPQFSLLGNTPAETHAGKPISSSNYKSYFVEEKALRIKQNQLNRCKKCIN